MVRRAAFDIINNVIIKGESLKTQDFDRKFVFSDKAFLKLLVYTVFRHINPLEQIIKSFVKKTPDKFLKNALYIGITQILYLNIPMHAAIFETVEMIKNTKFKNNAGFINGVLRNFSRNISSNRYTDNFLNFPDKFTDILKNDYSKDEIKQLSRYLEKEPFLDLTVKNDPHFWEKELNATINSGNNIRIKNSALITQLKGFNTGEWWVQSYAAYLPVTLFSQLKNKKTADLCAAPGGKTAQMITEGALVTAFDISKKRLTVLSENLKRLGYNAKIINENPITYKFSEKYDAVLVDAPCSGTGTFRKNPDVILKKINFNLLKKNQINLLDTACKIVKKSGEIVFSTCSLLTCEGEEIIREILKKHSDFSLLKEVRVLPDDTYTEGFYMALLKKG